jgi:hypothetical protein
MGRRPAYGPRFKSYRKLIAGRYRLFACEHCGSPAKATHHIIFAPTPGHDDPHYWIVLCGGCHAMTNMCIQRFEWPRLRECGVLSDAMLEAMTTRVPKPPGVVELPTKGADDETTT